MRGISFSPTRGNPGNCSSGTLADVPGATQIKNYPFEVLIAGTPQNVILADQVKSLDWRARKAVRKGALSFEEPVQEFRLLALRSKWLLYEDNS